MSHFQEVPEVRGRGISVQAEETFAVELALSAIEGLPAPQITRFRASESTRHRLRNIYREIGFDPSSAACRRRNGGRGRWW